MDQTFNKQKVVLVATQAIAWIKAERSRRINAYNAQSGWDRFWNELTCTMTRHGITHFESRRWQIAERLIFKATNCEDTIIFLSNDEIDQIRDFWSA